MTLDNFVSSSTLRIRRAVPTCSHGLQLPQSRAGLVKVIPRWLIQFQRTITIAKPLCRRMHVLHLCAVWTTPCDLPSAIEMLLKAAIRPQRGYRLQNTEHIQANMMHLADLTTPRTSRVSTYIQQFRHPIKTYPANCTRLLQKANITNACATRIPRPGHTAKAGHGRQWQYIGNSETRKSAEVNVAKESHAC